MSHAEGLRSFEQHMGEILYTALDKSQHQFLHNFQQRLESHPSLKEMMDEILAQAQLSLPPHTDSLSEIHKSQLDKSTTDLLPKRFRNVRCQAKRISQENTIQEAVQTDIAQGGFLSHPSHIKSKFVAGGKTLNTPPLYDLALELSIDNGLSGDPLNDSPDALGEDPNEEIDLHINPHTLTKVYIKEEGEDYYYDKDTQLLFIEEGSGNYLAVGILPEDHSVEWFT